MFIIRFFTGSIIGMIGGLILLLFGIFAVFVLAVGALAVTGSPGDCTPGDGPIVIDTAHSDAFKTKWDAFNSALDGSTASSVTLSESEISSRADTYLKTKNTPFKEPRVCLHDGNGEAQAKIKFLGLTAKVKIKGTLDLSGVHPKGHVDSIAVGNVPSWLTKPVETIVNRGLDSALNGVTLDHKYAPVLKPGEADVAGTP